MLRCPVCKKPLSLVERSFVCPQHHTFDRAAAGYVNLLLSNQKHSASPGDSKEMIQARREFLEQGYYDFLREEISRRIAQEFCGKTAAVLVDVGCGEGYYTAQFAQAAKGADPLAQVYGFDLSKDGLKIAARRDKNSLYAVASLGSMPLADHSVDLLVDVFAPYSNEEFARVLRPGGLLLTAVPAEEHLFGLKSYLYEIPYPNQLAPYPLADFLVEETATIRQEVIVTPGKDIQNLFAMTPYYWKTSREAVQRLHTLEELETSLHFGIITYRRKPL